MTTRELSVETVLLSDLVEAAEHGNEVLLMKQGEPLARLVPIRRRKAGSARGLFTVPDDFDDMDDFRDYM
jgi:prevent-host-death family protein